MAQRLIAICSCHSSFWDTTEGWERFTQHCEMMDGNVHHWVEVTDLTLVREVGSSNQRRVSRLYT